MILTNFFSRKINTLIKELSFVGITNVTVYTEEQVAKAAQEPRVLIECNSNPTSLNNLFKVYMVFRNTVENALDTSNEMFKVMNVIDKVLMFSKENSGMYKVKQQRIIGDNVVWEMSYNKSVKTINKDAFKYTSTHTGNSNLRLNY